MDAEERMEQSAIQRSDMQRVYRSYQEEGGIMWTCAVCKKEIFGTCYWTVPFGDPLCTVCYENTRPTKDKRRTETPIILSVKPKWATKIINKEKTRELRTSGLPAFVKQNYNDFGYLRRIFIYASSPVCKVIGHCEMIFGMIYNWHHSIEHSACVTKEEFDKLFEKNNFLYMYQIINVHSFDRGYDLSDFGISTAPQFYCYVKELPEGCD